MPLNTVIAGFRPVMPETSPEAVFTGPVTLPGSASQTVARAAAVHLVMALSYSGQ
jgi:hypothetical protein